MRFLTLPCNSQSSWRRTTHPHVAFDMHDPQQGWKSKKKSVIKDPNKKCENTQEWSEMFCTFYFLITTMCIQKFHLYNDEWVCHIIKVCNIFMLLINFENMERKWYVWKNSELQHNRLEIMSFLPQSAEPGYIYLKTAKLAWNLLQCAKTAMKDTMLGSTIHNLCT